MDGDTSVEFGEWLRPRLPRLLRLATALAVSRSAAEDLIQDVMVKAYIHRVRLRQMDDPDAYLRRMVVNQHISWRRRIARDRPAAAVDWQKNRTAARESNRTADWSAVGAAAAEGGAGSFDQRLVERAELTSLIARLPPRQRAVIVLRFLEDLSVEEAAGVLGCRASTVRADSSRALARLHVELQPQASAPPAAAPTVRPSSQPPRPRSAPPPAASTRDTTPDGTPDGTLNTALNRMPDPASFGGSHPAAGSRFGTKPARTDREGRHVH